jgi:hypothetical protein
LFCRKIQVVTTISDSRVGCWSVSGNGHSQVLDCIFIHDFE